VDAVTQQVRQAQFHVERHQLNKAETLLNALFAEHPEHPEVLFALGQLARKMGASENAVQLIGKAAYLLPNRVTPLLTLAEVMSDLKRFDHAESCYQRALQKFSQNPESYFSYCVFLIAQGRFEEAYQWLTALLNLSPEHPGGLSLLASLQPVDEVLTQKLIQALSRATKHSNLSDAIQLHYALGKAFDDQKNLAEAFANWQAANQLQLTQCDFRVAQMKPFFQAVKKAFTTADNGESDGGIKARISPIFIVGLPRSGSTLLEQMLASHPSIQTAGEVDYLASEVVAQINRLTCQEYPAGLDKLSAEQFSHLGEAYLKRLERDCQQAVPQSNSALKWVIDKLPANFQSIGLIKKILPQATIVHLTRDPMAVGFSIFRNYFEANEPYFCDLNEFREYHQEYRQLMDHWADLYPDDIIEVPYDSLVESPKKWLMKVLRYCELDWHEGCLEFHRQKNYIATLSNQQVRKPLYQSAKTKWREYNAFLSPYFTP